MQTFRTAITGGKRVAGVSKAVLRVIIDGMRSIVAELTLGVELFT